MGEFGIRAVRYVDYRVALVDEMVICFLSYLAQKKLRILSQIHVTFDGSLAPSRQFIPQPITATNSPILAPNAIFRSSSDKLM